MKWLKTLPDGGVPSASRADAQGLPLWFGLATKYLVTFHWVQEKVKSRHWTSVRIRDDWCCLTTNWSWELCVTLCWTLTSTPLSSSRLRPTQTALHRRYLQTFCVCPWREAEPFDVGFWFTNSHLQIYETSSVLHNYPTVKLKCVSSCLF